MIIAAMSLYKVRYEMRRPVTYSSVKGLTEVDSTIVELQSDTGLSGWGEVCPFGRTYLPAFAEGVRAALQVIGPEIPGCDATNIGALLGVMDRTVAGQPYAKSAVETALWDLLGQMSGLSVSALLGGVHGDRVPVPGGLISSTVPGELVAAMRDLRDRGYQHFSPKLSGTLSENLACVRALLDALEGDEYLLVDANGAWTRDDALRIADMLSGTPAYIEQPCRTYQECLEVARRTAVPLVLDEIMTEPSVLYQAWADGAIDGLKLKISRVGGLTQARRMTDFCAESGISVWVQEAAGGEIAQAAAGHLAVATAPRVMRGAVDLQVYNVQSLAHGGPAMEDGHLVVPQTPGLGVAPDRDRLGDPVAAFRLE